MNFLQKILIPKKIRFLVSSILLTVGFSYIQLIIDSNKLSLILILVLSTTVFSAWSLFEGLGRNMTLLSLILPPLFTLGVGTFWFLLPSNVYTKIPVIILFGVGVYVLLSTMNIYIVSASKTIALLRAARGVGFVLTLVTSFLIFDAILSMRENLYISLPLIFISAFLLLFQGLWSVNIEKNLDKLTVNLSVISALIIAELALIIFFWPVTVVVGSLFLTSGVYMLLGLGQTKIEDRLFPSVIREYLTVGLIVLVGMFFATHWGG